ncbi:MAG: response regulator [Bacteroidota bacterium]|nr:MAG: response regulator [Bacteroidota bacterium]
MSSDAGYENLKQENTALQAKVEALQHEIELLRKSFLPGENFYKDRFYRINENVNDVVYRFRFKERQYEYISPQVQKLFGYTPDDFYKNPAIIRHLIHPDSIKDYFFHWRNIIVGRIPEYFEMKIIRKNGEERWVLQKNLAIYNERKEIIAIEGIITDITERKITEQALIESEAQKKAILNNLPHLAWMKDLNGVYVSVNESFARRYKRSVEEIIGRTDYDLYPYDLAQQYRDGDLYVVVNKNQLQVEEKTDDTYWETIKAPIFDNSGVVIGVTGVALDVTEHKKKEETVKAFSEKLAVQNVKLKLINDELKLAKDKAEEADHLKTAFLANMSHEIRTPMNAILGFASLLRDRKISESKQVEFINLINSNCRQLLHIISDIIDISKIESDQISLFNKSFHVNRTIRSLKQNFENAIKQQNKDIDFQEVIELSDENDLIISDKARLEQVLSNLLSNAIKFTESGQVQFGYTCNSEKQEIVFFVSDTGIGISNEEQKIIFDRFRQVSSSYNKLYGGTGLGLSISKGLAKLMGGSIRLQSELNKGSTFYFTLPLKSGNVVKPEKIAFDTTYNWEGSTILIAEDEVANYTLLESIILPTKAKVLWVRNGVEAVDQCLTNANIDLVLMDIKMPDMNGLDATKQIRKKNNTLPIIAQTAFAMPQDEENCIAAGCDDYLSKPVQIDEILSKLNHYLRNKKSITQVPQKASH